MFGRERGPTGRLVVGERDRLSESDILQELDILRRQREVGHSESGVEASAKRGGNGGGRVGVGARMVVEGVWIRTGRGRRFPDRRISGREGHSGWDQKNRLVELGINRSIS